jgi:hypothetical protein
MNYERLHDGKLSPDDHEEMLVNKEVEEQSGAHVEQS